MDASSVARAGRQRFRVEVASFDSSAYLANHSFSGRTRAAVLDGIFGKRPAIGSGLKSPSR
jgi:hypothetical protein